MSLSDKLRDPKAARVLLDQIEGLVQRTGPVTFMEVCGTHTMAIYRQGLRSLLPASLRLLSGPGCPVCVTPNDFLDRAMALAQRPQTLIATFGDLMRVPGTSSSLQKERAQGCDIRVVYSTLDALELAQKNPKLDVIFLGVGFETTAPTLAAAVLEASAKGLSNFKVLMAAKTIMPAMHLLAKDGQLGLQGFLCPGHVSAIIGTSVYEPLATQHHIPCVIAGFEPLDILQAISLLLHQVAEHRAEVQNAYPRVVSKDGNTVAQKLLEKAFVPSETRWRGLGIIADSGLMLRPQYAPHDASRIEIQQKLPSREPPGCRCGHILRGLCEPWDCPLFGKVCHPDNPVGACMVSSEGTCAAAYRYGQERPQ